MYNMSPFTHLTLPPPPFQPVGYTTVAVNVTADLDKLETVTSKKKKMRKGGAAADDAALTDGFPDPAAIAFTTPVCPVQRGRSGDTGTWGGGGGQVCGICRQWRELVRGRRNKSA